MTLAARIGTKLDKEPPTYTSETPCLSTSFSMGRAMKVNSVISPVEMTPGVTTTKAQKLLLDGRPVCLLPSNGFSERRSLSLVSDKHLDVGIVFVTIDSNGGTCMMKGVQRFADHVFPCSL